MATILILFTTLVIFLLVLAYYRAYLHPLARIPGPRLAAITSWYEFYYECIKHGGGQVAQHLEELHDEYGPIVRINPWEVHIKDSDFFETFYSENKLNKDAFFWYPFGANESLASMVETTVHRTRRAVIAPCFSMTNVRKLEPAILDAVRLLLGHLNAYRRDGRPANLSDAFRCVSADVANVLTLPKPHLQLHDPGFANPLGKGLRAFASLLGWDRHLKFVFSVLKLTPPWLSASADSTGGTKAVVAFMAMFKQNAQIALSRTPSKTEENAFSTVLDTLAASTQLGSEHKTVHRLVDEASVLSAAATETTGSTMAALTFHILSKPSILYRLNEELQRAAEGPGAGGPKEEFLPYKTLEKLPYLQACISEALRASFPVSGRSPRVNNIKAFTYRCLSGHTYALPIGTVISMSIRDLHLDDTVYPDPYIFRPERWLEANARMQKQFVPFGRGSRNCIGSDLAKLEMTLVIGNLFYKMKMELYKTTERDITRAHDWFAQFAPDDSEGVRVLVKQSQVA